MWLKPAKLAAAVTLTLVAATVLMADDFSLDWWTIDGGGGMRTIGGDLELSGTLGQPDASATVLTGGGLELTGGFWVSGRRELPVVNPSEIEVTDGTMTPATPVP